MTSMKKTQNPVSVARLLTQHNELCSLVHALTRDKVQTTLEANNNNENEIHILESTVITI